ncbi:MAG TPA: hypothetical protein DHV26_14115 [Cytophagales bacterium]|nr:hypothetical protein [Cytophagales bacterium]
MRRLVFIVIFGLILSCDTERNIPLLAEDTFLKFYGVEGEQTGVDFVLTSDNAIAMVGNSTQPGGMQMIYVVKVDLNGKVIWENMIGLSDKNNAVKDIELHPVDGRLIIAGETEMAVGNRDVFVKILDGNGGELDSIRYGLNSYSLGNEEVTSITVISQGLTNSAGYIVTGSTTDILSPSVNDTKDGMVLRFTDSPLDIISDVSWRSKGIMDAEDVVVKMIQLDNNTYYGFGYTNISRTNRDFKYWLFRLNDDGVESGNSEAFFDALGSSVEDEKLLAVIDVNTPDLFDRGYLLCGIATNQSGISRPYLVKLKRSLVLNPANDVTAQFNGSTLGTDGSLKLNGYYNLLNNDYLISATQNVNSNLAEDLSLFKLDREIQPVWGPEVFGGESFDEAGAVLQLPDGKIMVLGTMTVGGLNGQKKMALMKLNDKGKLLR